MNELKNWKEITKGLYRYVISSNVAYEIHILNWSHNTDILSANAKLYIVGDWRDDNESFFEREVLLTGPLVACLTKAVEDNKENNS